MNKTRYLAVITVLLILLSGCKAKDVEVTESPDVNNIKISGAKQVGKDTTVSFSYDTKSAKGGTAVIEVWDTRDHMRDEHIEQLKSQTGKVSWTFKPTVASEHQFWVTVKNGTDEASSREKANITDTDDKSARREVTNKFSGFYNMEYQNVQDWPEYEGWNGNVLIMVYSDDTVRLVAQRDENKRVRDGVLEGDKIIFKDKERNTVHEIEYKDDMMLYGKFESPPGEKKANISLVRN